MSLATRLAHHAYRRLTRLYPPSFRAEFAAEMQHVFDALLAETAPRGPRALAALYLKEVIGLLAGLLREYGHGLRRINLMNAATLHRLGVILAVFEIGLLAGLYLLFDYLEAISVLWLFTPAVLTIVGLFGLLALRRKRSRQRLAVVALCVAVIAALPAIDWTSRKPFLRDLHRIEPGMTVAEVDRLMSRYLRLPAEVGTLSERQTVVYQHTTEGWGNSDAGLVTYRAGRVIDVEFAHD